MSTKDKYGREYAKLSALKDGDFIKIDSGFTCAPASVRSVRQDERGLYFKCSDGNHYLAGQADDGEHCVGIVHIR